MSNPVLEKIKNAKSRPWESVTEDDARKAIEGTAINEMVKEFEAVTTPALPLAASLLKALALTGCALSGEKEDFGVEEDDQRQGAKRARLMIETGSGQVANMYCLLVAESGSGKDIGYRHEVHANQQGWSVGTAGSAEGLADAFMDQPNGLLAISELEKYLTRGTWQSQATPFLTECFSKGWFHQRFSKRIEGKERRTDYCYPNVIANIQPDILARKADADALDSGFLNRFLIGRMPRAYSRPTTINFSDLEKRTEDAIRCYTSKCGVVYVEEGYMENLRRSLYDSEAPMPGHWSRLVNEYGPRLAVILSVKSGDISPSISLTDDAWKRAETLVMWFYAQGARTLESVAEDEQSAKQEALMKRIYRCVQNRASKGDETQKADISRNCSKGGDAKRRNAAIGELVARGIFTIDDRGSYSIARKCREYDA
jgi:hypothetical protein